jgi:hypothetical protein
MLCCLLANTWRDKKKKERPFKIEDFMPFRERKPKTEAELKAAWKRMCEM